MNIDKRKAVILGLLQEAYEKRTYDLSNSILLSQEALEQSKKHNYSYLIAQSLNRLSLFYMIQGKNDIALKSAEEAIVYFTELKDEKGIADVKYSIGGIYYKSNNYHLGMVSLSASLDIYSKLKDYHNISKTQKSLGAIFEFLGDKFNAKRAYQAAVKAALKCGEKNLESNAYNPLSGMLLKEGKVEEAMDMINLSIRLKEESKDKRGYAYAIYGRGKIHLHQKQYDKAERDLNDALKIHESYEDHFGIGMSYGQIAKLWLSKGNREQAKLMLKKAIDLSTRQNQFYSKQKCGYSLYEIYKEENDTEKALHYLEQYTVDKKNVITSQTAKLIENYEFIIGKEAREREDKLRREKEEIALKQERAEQSSKLRQDFLSSISHEIRTPLNAIIGIIDLLKERPNADEDELISSLHFSSKNLLRIINNVLDFSKLESNKLKLDIHQVNFEAFLHNLKETYKVLADEKGIALNAIAAPKVGQSYWMDETRLFQILGNLLSNAVKFTKEGSVAMIIDLLQSDESSDTLRFAVKDTGIGISKKEQKRLFTSFYTPKSITTRKEGGTGLGLAIVKELVKLHGGTIDLSSTPEIGSEFFFTLKLKRSKIPAIEKETLTKTIEGKTAILAEDNEINALVLCKLLDDWGLKTKRAKNGIEALELAKKEVVDYILMDIHMPELNGFDATEKIRITQNPNQTTKIFALTADITVASDKHYAKFFDGFLWKPIEKNRLFDVLVKTNISKNKALSIGEDL